MLYILYRIIYLNIKNERYRHTYMNGLQLWKRPLHIGFYHISCLPLVWYICKSVHAKLCVVKHLKTNDLCCFFFLKKVRALFKNCYTIGHLPNFCRSPFYFIPFRESIWITYNQRVKRNLFCEKWIVF
jgi:hypothetical protein